MGKVLEAMANGMSRCYGMAEATVTCTSPTCPRWRGLRRMRISPGDNRQKKEVLERPGDEKSLHFPLRLVAHIPFALIPGVQGRIALCWRSIPSTTDTLHLDEVVVVCLYGLLAPYATRFACGIEGDAKRTTGLAAKQAIRRHYVAFGHSGYLRFGGQDAVHPA